MDDFEPIITLDTTAEFINLILNVPTRSVSIQHKGTHIAYVSYITFKCLYILYAIISQFMLNKNSETDPLLTLIYKL